MIIQVGLSFRFPRNIWNLVCLFFLLCTSRTQGHRLRIQFMNLCDFLSCFFIFLQMISYFGRNAYYLQLNRTIGSSLVEGRNWMMIYVQQNMGDRWCTLSQHLQGYEVVHVMEKNKKLKTRQFMEIGVAMHFRKLVTFGVRLFYCIFQMGVLFITRFLNILIV